MPPWYPPQPMPSNLPFQPAAGSHTSMRMCESNVGVNVAVTRQKAGRLAWPANDPAGISCAAVMAVFGRDNWVRSVQLDAAAVAAWSPRVATKAVTATGIPNRLCFIGLPPLVVVQSTLRDATLE